ncbi:hypothetical protein JQC92_08265 [Shewanella sp. 202IG2-18]|uniref:hypothetical protein n=1 Tax=Parashewanella hymeniacidonis TaxID=2807618 RepID=UPI001960AEED|nr:hypothetical protein [Parashewanella hymeniacidonis]MBM7072022.1 hypothetical protein [Parashewanella hymeniacidonis]
MVNRIISVVLLVLFVVVWLLVDDYLSDNPHEKKFHSSAEIKKNVIVSADINSSLNKATAVGVTHSMSCDRLKDTKLQNKLSDFYMQVAAKYIDAGYRLDDVTQALSFVAGKDVAAAFRLSQLRQDSDFAAKTDERMQYLREEWQTFSDKPFPFKAERRVPAKAFDGLLSKPLEEQQVILSHHALSVDDLAYFLLFEKGNEGDLLRLLVHTTGVEQVVGFSALDSSSILDYAIYGNHARSVNALLNRGVLPSHDAFLASSMDWAMYNLAKQMANHGSSAVTQAVSILETLNDYQLSTRWTESSSSEIVGSFSGFSYQFDASDIEYLNNEYGLNLKSFFRAPVMLPSSNDLVEKMRHDAAVLAFDSNKVREDYAACFKLVH